MRALLLSMIVLFSLQALAVEPETWRVTSTEDFLAGEMEGFAVTSSGELIPGPRVEKLASFDDPFVFSQVTAEDGAIYFGTGNEGKVYRLRRGTLDLLLDTDEQQIHALEIRGNDLFVGSSPNGTIYRVDLRDGSSEPWAEIGEAYIWDIAAVGDSGLAVATGIEGKLILVEGRNQSRPLFDAPEMHLRSIAVLPDGTLLVGGSGEGRIYEVAPGGEARAIYDSSLTEISSLYFDPRSSTVWAAAGTSVLPTSAPQQQQQQKSEGQQESGSSQQRESEASVSVSFSFDAGAQGLVTAKPTGSSELYRIGKDGLVETVWRLDREIIYSIDGAVEGEGVVVSTGANGRVYRIRNGEVALVADLPEKQVVSYRTSGHRAIATTTNAGAVYELNFAAPSAASFESVVRDTKRLSRFGEYRVEGRSLPRELTLSWRSGNTATPDDTWSRWRETTGSSGQITAPHARYLQWKLEMAQPASDARIDEISSVFVNRNLAPAIESITLADPAVVFLSGGYPTSPGVVEATNPDQYGIFTSLEAPSQQESGKKYFRKGFRTVSWKSSDPNGDTLKYDLHFRRRGMSEWLRLREEVRSDQINFDTSQLPDGEYELKLTVTDVLSNPTEPKTAERSGVFFTIDNVAPVIRSRSSEGGVLVTIEDAASPVSKVEYSVDAKEWKPLLPEDGISDSLSETYRLSGEETRGRFVIVRAVDAFYNVSTAAIE